MSNAIVVDSGSEESDDEVVIDEARSGPVRPRMHRHIHRVSPLAPPGLPVRLASPRPQVNNRPPSGFVQRQILAEGEPQRLALPPHLQSPPNAGGSNGSGSERPGSAVSLAGSDGAAATDKASSASSGADAAAAAAAAAGADIPVEKHNALVFNELKKAIKCPVCLCTIENMTSTKCGHVFCKECIVEAIGTQHKCPTCRNKLTLKDIHALYL